MIKHRVVEDVLQVIVVIAILGGAALLALLLIRDNPNHEILSATSIDELFKIAISIGIPVIIYSVARSNTSLKVLNDLTAEVAFLKGQIQAISSQLSQANNQLYVANTQLTALQRDSAIRHDNSEASIAMADTLHAANTANDQNAAKLPIHDAIIPELPPNGQNTMQLPVQITITGDGDGTSK